MKQYVFIREGDDPFERMSYVYLMSHDDDPDNRADVVDVLGTFPALDEARAFAGREAAGAEYGLHVAQYKLVSVGAAKGGWLVSGMWEG